MAGTAVTAIIGALGAGKQAHDTRKERISGEERQRKSIEEDAAMRAAGLLEAEHAAKRKQTEELARRGRRASILTSPRGLQDDPLGVVNTG